MLLKDEIHIVNEGYVFVVKVFVKKIHYQILKPYDGVIMLPLYHEMIKNKIYVELVDGVEKDINGKEELCY